MREKLRLFFGRERDLARRWATRLRRGARLLGGRAPPPWLHKQMQRRAKGKPRKGGAGPVGLPKRPILRQRKLGVSTRTWTSPAGLGSFLISLSVHVLVLILLVQILISAPTPSPPGPELTVRFRLLRPPAPEKPVESPDPTPEEPPAPEELTKSEVVKREPLPEPKSPETKRSAEPRDSQPGGPPRRRARTEPLGLGPGPPPLEATGNTDGSSAFPSRSQGKSEALRRYGGGGDTENAVELGLRWLAQHQDPSGGWDAAGFSRHCRHVTPCRGKGFPEFDVGVTSLALLAFLGAGHNPTRDGPYREHVAKGLEFLKSTQDGSGAFGKRGKNYMYNHALATFVLSESYGVTGRRSYAESVTAALRFSMAAQQTGGGWDYTSARTGRNDLSVTGWQVMALRSAQEADIYVAEDMRQRMRGFVRRAFTPDGFGIYADRNPEAGRRGINMVAVGLLSYLYLGGLPHEPKVHRALDRLLAPGHLPDSAKFRDWDRTFQSYGHWYSSTLCLFHTGDSRRWEAWNDRLKTVLLPLQSRRGHTEGSWDPEQNWIGSSGGRVYATAINVLTMEVYYRYEPLFGTRRR